MQCEELTSEGLGLVAGANYNGLPGSHGHPNGRPQAPVDNAATGKQLKRVAFALEEELICRSKVAHNQLIMSRGI